MPPVGEQLLIRAAEGPDALPLDEEPVDRPAGIPVRWHEVPDFYASGPRDRHYTLDHLTGEVRFGDGLNGLIPPVGASNIRMSRYRSGGGAAGNQPAGAIVQLKTTVPYVDAVTNVEPAAGGADAETIPELVDRAPCTMRHRGQAVTREDYEDLAHLASPAVARALCVPNYDLAADPDGTRFVAGAVSLIIVPDAGALAQSGGRPLPTTELLNQVQDYLDRRRIPTADLIVVGPDYVRVDVSGEVVLASLEGVSRTERAVAEAISAYLHPLTGGPEGAGWAFGRLPQRSDLYRVIEALPGVDHVRSLALDLVPDRPGADRTGRFLVYGGEPVITLIYEGG